MPTLKNRLALCKLPLSDDAMPKPSAWFSDTILRRLCKNAGWLLGADVLSSLIRLATMVITARTLGVANFGVLATVQAYFAIANGTVNFQSWQALMKFGAEHQVHGRSRYLENLFKLGLLVDLSTAILGAVLAAALAPLIGAWLAWDGSVTSSAVLYSFVILFNLEGTSVAVLRLRDKFRIIGLRKVLSSLFKLVITLVACATTNSLVTFILVCAIAQLFDYAIMLVLTFRELANAKLAPVRRGIARRGYRENPGILMFVVTTNIHATVKMLPELFDVLIIFAVLGKTPTGIYKVVKECGGVLRRVIQPLYQSIYPELVKLAADRKLAIMVRTVWRSSVLAGVLSIGFWIVVILAGCPVLTAMFGGEYAAEYAFLVLYTFAIVISTTSFPITPALLALGRPKLPLFAVAIAVLTYLGSLVVLLRMYGLVGAGVAYIIFYVTWLLVVGLGIAATFRLGTTLGNAATPNHPPSLIRLSTQPVVPPNSQA